MSFSQNPNELIMSRNRTAILSSFMSKVYAWMMAGIVVTALVSYFVGQDVQLVANIVNNKPFFYGLIIVQLGAVFALSAFINRLSAEAAGITFIAYSALTGLTISTIFVVYAMQSIAGAFATTAIAFGGLSMFGFTTKRDLGPLGTFCIMGVFGLVGMMLLSFIFPSLNSSTMQTGMSIAALVIFSGLTAYDTQRIKTYASLPNPNQMAILGALQLYLDFLNIFLSLLQLFGDRK